MQNAKQTIIDEFVHHLSQNGYPGLSVDAWPDTMNRNSPEIDAVAGKIAIEHTSIDTLHEQRKRGAYFEQFNLGFVKDERNFSFQLTIFIPYDAFKLKTNWRPIKQALRDWIQAQAQTLPEGVHAFDGLENIPFGFQAMRINAKPYGLFFARIAPHGHGLGPRLRSLIERKTDKLTRYKNQGYETMLLIESGDRALMNQAIFSRALNAEYQEGLPSDLDYLWFVHNIDNGHLYFLRVK